MGDSSALPLETVPTPALCTPKRTPLTHLEPIGMGGGMTESLTSYMIRLAQAHCISVKDLISSSLMSSFARQYFLSPHGTRSSSWSRASRAINGTGIWARDAVQSLQVLVGREDLRPLTMLPWVGAIPQRGLLKQSKAWCPLCYRDWFQEGLPLYDPLIWFLGPVRMCANHQRGLETRCPHCYKEIPSLSSHALPGTCLACGSPLWAVTQGDSKGCTLEPRERRWQTWMIEQLGEMLAFAWHGLARSGATLLRSTYKACVQALFPDNLSEAARLLQVSPKTLREWVAGTQLPSLESLLRSCYCFAISPVDAIAGLAQAPSLADVRMPLWLGGRCPTKPPRIFDKVALLTALEEVATANYLFPPSMADVSRSLDIDVSHLMRLFPGVCAQISHRYLAFVKHTREQHMHRTISEVRSITRDIHREGIYPGYDPVSSQMSHPWAMRSNEVRAAWKMTLSEIGLPDMTGMAPSGDGVRPDCRGTAQ